eukprot:12151059-Alexandrium_andersonii.AAC.1
MQPEKVPPPMPVDQVLPTMPTTPIQQPGPTIDQVLPPNPLQGFDLPDLPTGSFFDGFDRYG